MAGWWSSWGDKVGGGVRRLVGREPAEPARPATSGGPVHQAPARHADAWAWQPAVQRALDPGWQPRLRPDDFAAQLTSHQDPSLRRDLVHGVQPLGGGLVDGLAEVAPGSPRSWSATAELTVRPAPGRTPPVQRSLATFLADDRDGGSTGPALTTVSVQPPWLAEPSAPAEAVAPAATVGTAPDPAITPEVAGASDLPVARPARPELTPTTAGLTGSSVGTGSGSLDVSPTTARSVGVQREVVEPPGPVPVAGPETAARPDLPVVPSVSRLPADRALSSTAVPLPRVLPVSMGPVPARPAHRELPDPRSLPVLQRSAAPTDEPSTLTGPAFVPAPAPAPEDSAPLSGFAEAISRQLDPTEPSDAPSAAPDAVAPARTDLPVAARAPRGPAVQRTMVPPTRSAPPTAPDPTSTSPDPALPMTPSEADPGASVLPSAAEYVAPLVGAAEDVVGSADPLADAKAPVQRTADPLPVIPVLRPVVPADSSGTGPADVPRLPVVVRSVLADPSLTDPFVTGPSAAGPDFHGSYAATAHGARDEVRRNAPLTGSRPAAVQRTALEAIATAAVTGPVVQPLRFESAPARTPVEQRTATVGSAALPAGLPAPATTAVSRSVPPAPSTSLPTVVPGMVGPGPDGAGTVLSPAPALAPAARPAPAEPAPARPLQRLATATVGSAPHAPHAPGSHEPPVVPGAWRSSVPVRSLPFDQMFGPGDAGAGPAPDPGWTTVELPVVGEPALQRAVEVDEVTTAPEPSSAPAPSAAAPEPPPPAPVAAPPASPGPAAGLGGADLDEMARRLFDPLSARLRAELWLDRERAGLVADAHF